MRSIRPLRPLQPLHCPPIITHGRLLYSTATWGKRGSVKARRNSKKEDDDDHRALGTEYELFTTHDSSPGSPFFQPNGALIFQRLQAFLRAQYSSFGFREVVTPTIYKASLWKLSGHWDNYKDDMFSVSSRRSREQPAVREGADVTLSASPTPTSELNAANHDDGHDHDDIESGDYGLKPMNCPGHCLLFKSRKLSYRELPVRYADFSPLHRNEVSGSLSGLTRVRRFHQDDGHIFCRPSQVGEEIKNQLKFIDMVYETFGIPIYKLVLSTRPAEGNFIGTSQEWDRAEKQLEEALKASGQEWQHNHGDGAFYGPKIDIIVEDTDGKRHQTATIQLDFQLPQRFGLEYESPAPEQERLGLTTTDPKLLKQKGMVAPIMIHRAILGSLERFMALLIEHYKGRWPFWLSPRQVIVLAIGNKPQVLERAVSLQTFLRAPSTKEGQLKLRQPLDAPQYVVDVDLRDESLAKKVRDANMKKYNIICVIGERNVREGHIDVTLTETLDPKQTWKQVEMIKSGSQAPVQKGVAADMVRGMPGVKLYKDELATLMRRFVEGYL